MTEQSGSQDGYEIIIVGAGPAGLTAALYAGRSRIPTLVLERGIAGGQLWNTAEVEDYPGFEHIMGPDLADKMQQHAEKFGAKLETAEVTSISVDGDDRVVATADGRELRATAPSATGRSSRTRTSRSSAAATPRSRRAPSSPVTGARST
jgi:thioredoxin reductase (NADPH)